MQRVEHQTMRKEIEMAKFFKLFKPRKEFPDGIKPEMFCNARFVLIQKDEEAVDCFHLKVSDQKKDRQVVSIDRIPELPVKARPVTKRYFESLVY